MAKKQVIYQQEHALSAYLNDMLLETEETAPASEAPTSSKTIPANNNTVNAPQPLSAVTATPPPAKHHHQTKVLLCTIAGMSIAIPVEQLTNIIKWPAQALTQLPAKSPWVVGLYRARKPHTQVVDISQLLHSDSPAKPCSRQYILIIDAGRIGIACDAIQHIITLSEHDINWRSDSKQRPWLKGLVTQSMSSIIDVETLVTELKD